MVVGRVFIRSAALGGSAVALGLLGCVGSVDPGPPSPAHDGERGPVEPVGVGPAIPRAALAPPTLHRLRVDEYRNALVDLLGEHGGGVELEPDTALRGFTSFGAAELTIANTTAEKLEAAALEASRKVFADEGRRRALVGCVPRSASDGCAGGYIARFGRRAFRRPLSEPEQAEMQALASRLEETLGDVWLALSYTTSAFLQSPYFVFRVEIGEPDPEGRAPLRYTSYEMASRLSFVLLRSTPDEALLAAAERGELTTRDGLLREADRLMQTSRFRVALRRFFTEQLALDRLATLSKETSVFPRFRPTLRDAMRAELERLFDDLVFTQQGDYRDLLDTRTTFVETELATLYGISGVSGSELRRVTLPEAGPRAGILGTAGLLAIHASTTETSPTRRGKFVRSQILCQEIPPPPPGMNTSLAEPTRDQTMRERLSAHSRDPACSGCHAAMDPIGLAFEHFDGIGAYRATDRGRPIDARGVLDGAPFDGPRSLLALLKEHPATARCVARQLLRFATGRAESPEAGPLVDQLTEAFRASGYRLPALMREVVASDAFRRASLPDEVAAEEASGG